MLKSVQLALHAKKPYMLVSQPSRIPTSVFRAALVPNVLAKCNSEPQILFINLTKSRITFFSVQFALMPVHAIKLLKVRK